MEWETGLLGITLEDSDDEARIAKKERKQERMRQAFLHARDTYTAKLDTDEWFRDGLTLRSVSEIEMDTRASQRIQAVLTLFYYRKAYKDAWDWSCALLRRLYVLGEEVVWHHGRPAFQTPVASDKAALQHANSAVAKETLDTALRCVLHNHIPLREAEPVLAAGFEKAYLPSNDYAMLWQDERVNDTNIKTCAVGMLYLRQWTHNPGLCLSLGDACQALHLDRLAVEAYALAAGARGPHWRVCSHLLRSLCAMVEEDRANTPTELSVVARACATFALSSCKPTLRHTLLQDILSHSWLADRHYADTDSWDELAVLSAAPRLPRESYLALSYSFKRRGDMSALAQKLPDIVDMSMDMLKNGNTESFTLEADDPTDSAPRSVRTL